MLFPTPAWTFAVALDRVEVVDAFELFCADARRFSGIMTAVTRTAIVANSIIKTEEGLTFRRLIDTLAFIHSVTVVIHSSNVSNSPDSNPDNSLKEKCTGEYIRKYYIYCQANSYRNIGKLSQMR